MTLEGIGRVVTVLLAMPSTVMAGAAFPCPLAATSENGRFIAVLNNAGIKNGTSVVTVLSREPFINEKDRFSARADFWSSGGMWTILPQATVATQETGCSVPLITNDGAFLLLLQSGPRLSPEDIVMSIYRKSNSSDERATAPVGSIALKDLWPAEALRDPRSHFWTDETPQWFAGGTFRFSENNRSLIFTSRWGNVVRIDLEKGYVTDK